MELVCILCGVFVLLGKECVSILKTNDWRNIYANSAFMNSQVKLVRIADALYSQYDSHPGASGLLLLEESSDCTHWCYPSGVFQFILRKLYNTMRVSLTTMSTHTPLALNLSKYYGKIVRYITLKSHYHIMNDTRHYFANRNEMVAKGFDFDDVVIIKDISEWVSIMHDLKEV